METGFCFRIASCFLIFFSKASTAAIDTISPSELFTDAMTLVSNDGTFALGFFSPGTSKNRYLGIWYNNIPMQTVVWVANRINPINDSTGLLKIETSGRIVLLVQNTTAVWSTNSTAIVQNPVLQLLDSGNLVVKDGKDPDNYLWQSFDYPSDTLLPGMKIGIDLKTGFHRRLSAWKNWDDPTPGDLTFGIELQGNPEAVLRKGSEKYARSGLWNGNDFSGYQNLRRNPIFDYGFVWNENEVYYIQFTKDNSVILRGILNQTESAIQRYTWNPETQTWKLFLSSPIDLCGRYGHCGPNGNCDSTKLPACCQCLTGFRPKWPERWNSADYFGGCIHSKPLNCQSGDDFIRIRRVKTPDATKSWVNRTMNLMECRAKCLRNCSCTAYTNLYVTRGGSGCVMWFGDLIDIKQFQSDGRDDQDLYIRVSASETELKKKAKVKPIILATVIASLLGILLVVCYNRRSRRKLKDEVEDKNPSDKENKDENEDMELVVFEFSTIAQATDSFSFRYKLGQGGFGPVYKGTLPNGQEIAVKRLSKTSGQGLNEFKNEVKLIAKLQHRNLVRLLGCCAQGDERMLVYEYMPNRSLDSFIFDQTRREVLTWSKRFRIISGIARGLLYLHQDSRLRIIHRDLKPNNVLLDSEMNPKISDFGMARTFGGDQTEANTNRVVGTYGYMAPEYASDGLFSIKSDVFSYGILLLEVISGRKNRGVYHANQSENLVEHAWRLWTEGKPSDVAEDFLVQNGGPPQLLRCIHISLLCVQQHPEERPDMSSVVLMLGSHNELPSPKQPGFLFCKKPFEADSSPGTDGTSSRNEITSSLLEAR
ncbi:S-locus lectin protein kinase family protein [Hibiscus syriacus]|uniref:Receptor-like serine/threonine-protein kinase n=1 Tax=Hibiscus syriacus TaxID=106335 RepID=A0A6A2XX26_HIBSY|nr:G-type lectin S-receptor-like serine/threonine-protein kinase At4g27290 [Hibiscus syriacus]KAE8680178.1 S-locus lectin protein kinase family protein [Hibiscus syriacus]